MAVKLQTIKDIRNYLATELSDFFTRQELTSLTSNILMSLFEADTLASIMQVYEENADPGKVETLLKWCKELKTGKPFQYVLGETLFYGCKIKVNPAVLIPRPETEEMVDLIIRENRRFTGRIIDIGTGSGCIAIALAKNLPSSQVEGIDSSGEAVKTASENAAYNGTEVTFRVADILNVTPSEMINAGIIVSNPPYVKDSEKINMRNNVLGFEPHEALFVPDNDPLIFYRAILGFASHILNPGGLVYFEINEAMGKPVYDLIKSYEYREIRIIKDINGRDRIAKGEKND
jgi:release factor glutamine methyltransferase